MSKKGYMIFSEDKNGWDNLSQKARAFVCHVCQADTEARVSH